MGKRKKRLNGRRKGGREEASQKLKIEGRKNCGYEVRKKGRREVEEWWGRTKGMEKDKKGKGKKEKRKAKMKGKQ